MQENCTSGLPSGDWKRKGILAVRQPVTAPVVDSTEMSDYRGGLPCDGPCIHREFREGAEYRLYFDRAAQAERNFLWMQGTTGPPGGENSAFS